MCKTNLDHGVHASGSLHLVKSSLSEKILWDNKLSSAQISLRSDKQAQSNWDELREAQLLLGIKFVSDWLREAQLLFSI